MSKKLPDTKIKKILNLLLESENNQAKGEPHKGNSAIALEVFGRTSAESTVRRIKKVYKKHGNYFGIIPSEYDKSIEDDTSWQVEKETLDTLCEHPAFNVSNLAKRLRTAQRTNNQLRKIQREVFDGSEEGIPSLEDIFDKLSESISKVPNKVLNYKPTSAATPATLEIMISDIQIGKLTRHFNTKTCLAAMKQYGKDLLQEITDKSGKYHLERVIIELLGDLAEDDTKHGIQSAISTDCGLSEQLYLVTEALWENVLSPIANLGIEVEVVCVVGNHASSTHKGMGSFKEGKFGYDYVVFKTLEKFCNIANFTNVEFNIPEGTFAHTEIYGRHVILEHGYSNNISEKGMIDQMRKRGAQLKVHPTYWRQADKHHFICYGQGEQICNAAWFGVDTEGLEYSGILGFSSVPSQTVVWHTDERSVGKGTVKDIVNIQVFVEDA